jgi:3-dehydroquinate dehydratase/shikimate dehydrogenase
VENELNGPLIIGSVLEPDTDATRRSAARVPAGCGLVEIRGDELSAGELGLVIRTLGRPAVATVRRREDGGKFDGTERQRLSMLQSAFDAGARFVDVEWGSALEDWARGPRASRVILSHHGGECEIAWLVELHRAMAATGAARLKIVPHARSVEEIRAARELLRRTGGAGRRLSSFATGRYGALSRLLCPSWGSWATYASVSAGAETAEGQFTADDMLDVYDVLGLGPRTRLFVLVGERAFSSPSPAMHRTAYQAAGIDARYLPLELDGLSRLRETVGPEGPVPAAGLAVTIPFKEQVARECRLDDPVAQACGAVNTVRIDEDGWSGYNTDGSAALERVRGHLDPHGRGIAVVGAGGTACAVAAAFRDAGAIVSLFNRDVRRAERVGRRLGVAWYELDRLQSAAWDVLVNATPVGRGGEELLAPCQLSGRVVLDAVYASHPTPLVDAARQRGLAVVDGLELLAAQARHQFRLMTGQATECELLRTAGRRWLGTRA